MLLEYQIDIYILELVVKWHISILYMVLWKYVVVLLEEKEKGKLVRI